MISISKRKILFVMLFVILLVGIGLLFKYKLRIKAVQTVALPTNIKTVIIDARAWWRRWWSN